MSRQRTLDEIITTFFLNTCRLRPPVSEYYVLEGVVRCVEATTIHPPDDQEADFIPLITGSAAEFYIEPMLPHIGDIGVMLHLSTDLAIPRGHPPPTQLPPEFSDYAMFEVDDSHFPGYVYLPLRYLLTYCTDDDKYNHFEYDRGQYVSNSPCSFEEDSITCHGPAVFADFRHTSTL